MKRMILAISLLIPLSFYRVAAAQLTKLTIGNNTLSAAGLPAWMGVPGGLLPPANVDDRLLFAD